MYFGSRIKIISPQAFEHLPLAAMRKDHQYAPLPWTVRHRVGLSPRGYTDGIMNCQSGGFHNGINGTLIHLNPTDTVRNFDMVALTLACDVAALRSQPDAQPLRGTLIGGNSQIASEVLFDQLKDFFESQNIPISILNGRPDEHLGLERSVSMDAPQDTWWLTSPNLDLAAVRQAPLAQKERLLKEAFPEFSIAEGDILEIGD